MQPTQDPLPGSVRDARKTFICRLPDSRAFDDVALMFERRGCKVERFPDEFTLVVIREPEVIEPAA